MSDGVQRVDSDSDGTHLAQIVRQHNNMAIAKAIGNVEFRDDVLTDAPGPLRFADISPYGLKGKIEASGVPMMVWCGWLDANSCEGALIRYRTLSNPQLVVIGPLSHGGDFNVDPFARNHSPPVPTRPEQLKMQATFFSQTLGRQFPAKLESSIQYYTMGEGKWHTTKCWPPAGLSGEKFFLDERKTLSTTVPVKQGGADRYTVDFTASTGNHTRWHTQLGGADVVYGDRAVADTKLLAYTSAPLKIDLEITGSPVLTLQIASTTSDGAIHAYLEDVAPTGRVTYIDEGVFRVVNRKEIDPRNLPYESLGPAHSFRREDAEALKAGDPALIRFSLFPTSVLIRRGHAIRIALSGLMPVFSKDIQQAAHPTGQCIATRSDRHFWNYQRDCVNSEMASRTAAFQFLGTYNNPAPVRLGHRAPD